MNKAAPKPNTFQPDIYAKVISLLPDTRPFSILDVGSGESYLSLQLHEMGYQVKACDYQAENFKCSDIPFTTVDLNEHLTF